MDLFFVCVYRAYYLSPFAFLRCTPPQLNREPVNAPSVNQQSVNTYYREEARIIARWLHGKLPREAKHFKFTSLKLGVLH